MVISKTGSLMGGEKKYFMINFIMVLQINIMLEIGEKVKQ